MKWKDWLLGYDTGIEKTSTGPGRDLEVMNIRMKSIIIKISEKIGSHNHLIAILDCCLKWRSLPHPIWDTPGHLCEGFSSVALLHSALTLGRPGRSRDVAKCDLLLRAPGIMHDTSNQNDGPKQPRALASLCWHGAARQSRRWIPEQPMQSRTKATNATPLLRAPRTLSLQQGSPSNPLHGSWGFLQFYTESPIFIFHSSCFLEECAQKFSEWKSFDFHERSTSILRCVTKDQHLLCKYHYAKEQFQTSNSKSDENWHYTFSSYSERQIHFNSLMLYMRNRK